MVSLLLALTCVITSICRSYREKSGNNLSLWEGTRPLVPTFILFSLVTIWAFSSPYGIIRKHPRIFYTVTGMVFSNIAVSVKFLFAFLRCCGFEMKKLHTNCKTRRSVISFPIFRTLQTHPNLSAMECCVSLHTNIEITGFLKQETT